MKVFYKKVKIAMPHCGVCKERLLGENSIMFPYKCSCGIWEARDWDNPLELTLKDIQGEK